MRNAKIHKIFLTVAIAMLMTVVALFPMVNKTAASADTASVASDYFSGISSSDLSFEGGYFVAKIREDSISKGEVIDSETNETEKNVLSIDNLLVINDFGMELIVPDGLKSLTVVFKNEAFYENGNPMVKRDSNGQFVKVNGEYDFEVKKEIVNELTFNFETQMMTFNGDSANTTAFTRTGNSIEIFTSLENGYLKAIVGSASLVASDVVFAGETVEYRKIQSVDGLAMAEIKFMFKLTSAFNDTTPYVFKIGYVDQKVSDANRRYKQTFETNADGALTNRDVYARVAIDESFYKKNPDGTYVIKKDVMQKYTLTFKVFALLNDVTATDVYIKANDSDIWTDPSVSTPKSIQFLTEKNGYAFDICGRENAVYESISGIEIVNFEEDVKAPEYLIATADPVARKSFELALKDAYYNSEEGHYIALGESVEVPSMKDLVFDDCYGYESLTKSVTYASETSDKMNMSGTHISLSSAGRYYFFMSFGDGAGNEMDADRDFVKSEYNPAPKYEGYIFSFYVSDNAPIDVTPPVGQGLGYVGIEYRASAFGINAEGCKTEYKLYYNAKDNATADDEGWIEVPNASKVTDKDFDNGDYNYNEVQAIGFKGTLVFTPDKAGAFMIECNVTSTVTSRFDTEYTIIKVTDDVMTVKPIDNSWMEDNVWSLVFLGVGSVCLIAIVVLLFIKPKNVDEVEE